MCSDVKHCRLDINVVALEAGMQKKIAKPTILFVLFCNNLDDLHSSEITKFNIYENCLRKCYGFEQSMFHNADVVLIKGYCISAVMWYVIASESASLMNELC